MALPPALEFWRVSADQSFTVLRSALPAGYRHWVHFLPFNELITVTVGLG